MTAARSLRCRLGFHRLIRVELRGWFERVMCDRCGKTGWRPSRV